MSNVQQKAKQLNSYLLQLEVVKEFQEYERRIQEDTTLQALEVHMKQLQKQIVQQKAARESTVVDTMATYEKVRKTFEENPLYVNYKYLKEEVDSLLQEVNSRINGQLSNQDLTK